MALKYKIGDRVRIKSIDWYNENKDKVGNILYKRDGSAYPVFFSKYMSNFCGEILTIKSVFKHSYHMNETSSCEFWTDEMIEGLVEEETKIEPKFKVGDKVILDPYPCVVTDVNWRDSLHGFVYTVRGADFGKMVGEEDLVLDESEKKLSDESWRYKNIFDSSQYPQSFECPEGYKFVDENGNVINAQKIVLEKKKNEYPKTYEECSVLLGCEDKIPLKIIGEFTRLINARNAYWKVYGEEKGLGKPWAPDWINPEQMKYTIYYYKGGIKKDYWHCHGHILAFPTEEMMEEFYENFKKEIEMCKELL